MIIINEKGAIKESNLGFKDCLLDLLSEYKKEKKVADNEFALKLLRSIYTDNYLQVNYVCSMKKSVVAFDINSKCLFIDSKTLLDLSIKYIYKKRKNNLLCNNEDAITNTNIIFSHLILHEIIHILQYRICIGEIKTDDIYKDVYGLMINKIKNNNFSLLDSLIYRMNHSKYVVEKSATCYALEIMLELLKNTNLIESESLNDLTSIYFKQLIGNYKYNKENVVGECKKTYDLLREKSKYQELKINPNIPLYIKMSNGFTLQKPEFDNFKNVIASLNPISAKEKIKKM